MGEEEEAGVIEIVVKGPGPFGFRLYGGEGDPLVVAKLRSKSKAHDAGLREGDVVLGINGRSCQTISHGVAMALLESADDALRLHLHRGSATSDSLSSAYQSLGSQLRPVPPGTEPPNRSIFSIQPTPATHPPPSHHPPPLHQPPAHQHEPTASFSRQQEVTSLGANASQTITTDTETKDLGGVTLTKVTRHVVLETGAGGTIWSPSQEPAKRGDDVRVQSPAIFHVPKIKAQPLRWQPDGSSQAAPAAVDRIVVGRPVTVDVSPIGGSGGQRDEVPRAYGRVAPPREEQATFKVPKTSAKPWVWQPSFVPDLPVREPSPSLSFQVLEASQGQPYENHREESEEGPGRRGGGARSADDLGLSPDLIRVLTTEGAEDDWAAMMRRKKIFADSSFYDDPDQRYPTIEEQIKMARRVALSLSAPDNVTARGQRMFMKRKEKANQWTSDNHAYDGLVTLPKRSASTGPRQPQRASTPSGSQDLYYNPTPWKTPTSKKVEKVSLDLRVRPVDGYPEEAHVSFNKNRALFERGVRHREGTQAPPHYDRSGKKVHASGTLAPRACHGLANEMKGMRGKGARLFAQRRAKLAEEEEEERAEGEGQGGWQSEGEAGLRRERSQEGAGYDYPDPSEQASVRRLEELIAISKAYLTPWESTPGRQGTTKGGQPAKGVANEQEQQFKGAAAEQKTSDGSRPNFLGKAASGGYRPVKFHLHSNFYSVPGVSEF